MIRRRTTGFFPGSNGHDKNGYDSTLERDFLELLRFDRTVIEFRVQHPKINFLGADGNEHTYTPDVWVKYDLPGNKQRVVIYEVKASALLRKDWLELKPKFKAARAYASARNCTFKILNEKRIRTAYLVNARFLTRYRDIEPKTECVAALIEVISELRESDAQGILATTILPHWDRAHLLPVLWHLVSLGRIGADLRQPLTMKSRLWSNEQRS